MFVEDNELLLSILRDGGGIVENGHFLTKGQRCTFTYFKKPREIEPSVLEELAFCQVKKLGMAISRDAQIVVAVPTGGTDLARELIRLSGRDLPLVVLEKSGLVFKLSEADKELFPGKHTIIVDDNLTSGFSLNKGIKILRNHGANVFCATALVDRSATSSKVSTQFVSLIRCEVPVFEQPCEKCLAGIAWDPIYGYGKYHVAEQFELPLPQ